jgi:hypothetical protein
MGSLRLALRNRPSTLNQDHMPSIRILTPSPPYLSVFTIPFRASTFRTLAMKQRETNLPLDAAGIRTGSDPRKTSVPISQNHYLPPSLAFTFPPARTRPISSGLDGRASYMGTARNNPYRISRTGSLRTSPRSPLL